MKVLVHAPCPWWPTGMGGQADLLGRMLSQLGHEAIFSAVGQAWAASEWRGSLVLPAGPSMPNLPTTAALIRNAELVDPDLVLALTDPWTLLGEELRELPLVAITNVSHDPLSPMIEQSFVESQAVPVAITRWGQSVMAQAGLDNALYLPHAVDCELFRPGDRSAARAGLGLPESAFVVGIVAMNRRGNRKGLREGLEAFARFQRQHPDAILYLHSSPSDGEDLTGLVEQLGIGQAIHWPDPDAYALGLYGPAAMAETVYPAMNVLLHPSWGEGFGLPIIEAQACGVPVIATDFGAMAELTEPTVGWTVGGEPVKDSSYLDSWLTRPSVDGLVEALEASYGSADRPDPRDPAREHALQYSVESVQDTFLAPTLVEIEGRIGRVPSAA